VERAVSVAERRKRQREIESFREEKRLRDAKLPEVDMWVFPTIPSLLWSRRCRSIESYSIMLKHRTETGTRLYLIGFVAFI
jgi:hypothetical protein